MALLRNLKELVLDDLEWAQRLIRMPFGAQTRVRVLDMLASTRTPLLAYHFPWPGIGHAVKHGEGFHFLPAPMQMVL